MIEGEEEEEKEKEDDDKIGGDREKEGRERRHTG
jgi:hypothetical protein